jgi:hypothetical protein
LEPLLYRTLTVGAEPILGLPPCNIDTFADIARAKSPMFRRDSMRNLLLNRTPKSLVNTYLSLFPGVENLWILPYLDNAPAPTIEILPLKHLYCHLDDLYRLIPFESFGHPLFTNIMHLELFSGFHQHRIKQENSTEWTGLGALPHLTHLALNNTGLIPLCVPILETYESLRALLILGILPKRLPPDVDILAADPRFVMTPVDDYLKDWQRGALTGRDYWARADAFIAKRISGEIGRELHLDNLRVRHCLHVFQAAAFSSRFKPSVVRHLHLRSLFVSLFPQSPSLIQSARRFLHSLPYVALSSISLASKLLSLPPFIVHLVRETWVLRAVYADVRLRRDAAVRGAKVITHHRSRRGPNLV